MVKLVDTHVSGACAARYAGSSPAFGTIGSPVINLIGLFSWTKGRDPDVLSRSHAFGAIDKPDPKKGRFIYSCGSEVIIKLR